MSDHEIDLEAAIVAAIAAAGPRGTNEGQWVAKVNNAIPRIVSMMGEGSRQWRIAQEVASASVFTAVYRGYTLEQSSTRCVVKIETKPSKKYPDGIEPIRSHRTDNGQGKNMMLQLDQLADGDDVVVWKALETNTKDGEDIKIRVLVHIEKRPKFNNQHREPTGTAEAKPARYSDSIDSDQLQRWRANTREILSPEQYTEVVERLAKRGYDMDGVSEIEWVEEVRPVIVAVREPKEQP